MFRSNRDRSAMALETTLSDEKTTVRFQAFQRSPRFPTLFQDGLNGP